MTVFRMGTAPMVWEGEKAKMVSVSPPEFSSLVTSKPLALMEFSMQKKGHGSEHRPS